MISTYVISKGLISAPIEKVWPIIRGFNSLPKWHPYVNTSSLIEGSCEASVGAVRKFEQTDGSVVVERLLGLDDLNYSIKYRLLEAPIPVENYIASIDLIPVPSLNKTIISWRADYQTAPDVAANLNIKLDEVFRMGFDKLNKMLINS